MPEIMRLAFKYKLRPNRKQEQAMRNFSGCCRFAYNALLAQEKEEYQEYLEELESRLCCGEALSKDEAKALCVKPKLNQYTFNYALKKLKEEYPFLKEFRRALRRTQTTAGYFFPKSAMSDTAIQER